MAELPAAAEVMTRHPAPAPAPAVATAEAVQGPVAAPESIAPVTEPEKPAGLTSSAAPQDVVPPTAVPLSAVPLSAVPLSAVPLSAGANPRRRGRPKKSETVVAQTKEPVAVPIPAPVITTVGPMVPADRTVFVQANHGQARPGDAKRPARPHTRRTEIIPLTSTETPAPPATAPAVSPAANSQPRRPATEPARTHTPHVRRGNDAAARPIR